ncbi:MAG: sugar transferase [Vicinamibacterales bacterium]
MRGWQLVKRTIDLMIATAGLILGSPVFALVALAVLVLEGRPIFYVSRRHVTPEKTVRIFKFRSMVRDATSPHYRLAERFMKDGFLDIPLSCEVFTPVGRFLERTQLVELPQLLNVLIDGMSLIGNRPLPPENVRLLRQKYPRAVGRFDAPAGISGIAQVVGKLNLQPEQRLALELGYVDLYRKGNIVRCDTLVLIYTVRVLLGGPGVTLDQARWMLHPIQCDPMSIASAATTSGEA